MGRFTSAATQSSSNPTNASLTYSEATGIKPSDGTTADDPDNPKKPAKKKRLVVHTIDNVSSSNAGASSANFHVYRRERNVEKARMESMQRQRDELDEDKKLKKDLAEKNAICDQKTSKNALKRKKRKRAQLAARKRAKQDKQQLRESGGNGDGSSSSSSGGSGSGSGSGTKSESSQAMLTLPEFKGVNKNSFKNNGSFLAVLAATGKIK